MNKYMFKTFKYILPLLLSSLLINPVQARTPNPSIRLKELPSELSQMLDYTSPMGIKGSYYPVVPLGTPLQTRAEVYCASYVVEEYAKLNLKPRIVFEVESYGDPSHLTIPALEVECNQPFDIPFLLTGEGIFSVTGQLFFFEAGKDTPTPIYHFGGYILEDFNPETDTVQGLGKIHYSFMVLGDDVHIGQDDAVYPYTTKQTLEHYYQIKINEDWSLAEPFTIKNTRLLQNDPNLSFRAQKNADGSYTWDILTRELSYYLLGHASALYNEQPELFQPYFTLKDRNTTNYRGQKAIELYKNAHQRAHNNGLLRKPLLLSLKTGKTMLNHRPVPVWEKIMSPSRQVMRLKSILLGLEWG